MHLILIFNNNKVIESKVNKIKIFFKIKDQTKII